MSTMPTVFLRFALSTISLVSLLGCGGSSPAAPTATDLVVDTAKDQSLTIVLSGSAGANQFATATAPANGTLSGVAPNLTYTPQTGFVGIDSFTFTVSTGSQTSVPATVTVYVTDWQQVAPPGGFIATAAFHPTKSNELWVSADDGSGLFRSTNSGTSFQRLTSVPINQSAYVFRFTPGSPNTVYAANHFGRGILKTTDGGSTWTVVGSGLPTTGLDTKKLHDLAIDPGATSTLWAATSSGLFKSTNGGVTFSQVTSMTFGQNDFRAVALNSSSRICAATVGGGVYTSTNGGSSWTQLIAPTTPSPFVSDIAVTANAVYVGYGLGFVTRIAGFSAANILIINDPNSSGFKSGFWTKQEALSGAGVGSDTLYVGTTWTSGSSNWGFYVSTNGGGSFTQRNSGLNGASVFDIAVDPQNSSRLLYPTVNDGLFLSTNAGTTWSAIGNGAQGIQGHASLAFDEDPNNTNHIVFSSVASFPGTSNTLQTTNGGTSWTEITALANIDVIDIRFVPGSSTEMLAATFNAGIYRSTNGPSGPWSVALARTKRIKRLTFSPANPARVYAVLDDPSTDPEAGLYTSSNRGQSWSKVLTNDTTGGKIYLAVAGHPTVRDEVVVVGVDAFAATDAAAGGTNSLRSLGLAAAVPNRLFTSVAFDPQNPTTLYVGSIAGELYRTTNYNNSGTNVSWTKINTPLLAVHANDILVRRSNGITSLFVVGWIGDTAQDPVSTPGLIRSDDGGATWTFLDAGIGPCSMIWQARPSNTARRLWAGLWGGGLLRLDW